MMFTKFGEMNSYKEINELAAEPQREGGTEREDPESGEHEQERTERPAPAVEEQEKTVISPAKKTEEKAEETVPEIIENVAEIAASVPENKENVIEAETKVIHQIKLEAEFFDDALSGRKSFELRKNDRNYEEGDVLEMEEVKDGAKTGRKCSKRIVYMMENFEGLENGYCILGCELL